MNKIEIEIPDGKKAKWVNGVLTLVDDKSKHITERVKTLEDACNILGYEHPLVSQYYRAVATFKYESMTKDLIAGLKLRIICAALNEGWKPIFSKDENRYCPLFDIYTQSEYKELNKNKKKYCLPLRSNNNVISGEDSVFAYAVTTGYTGLYSLMDSSMRLVLKTRELAEYCGKQFLPIWADYLLK